jgi:hypothetical protein
LIKTHLKNTSARSKNVVQAVTPSFPAVTVNNPAPVMPPGVRKPSARAAVSKAVPAVKSGIKKKNPSTVKSREKKV